MKKNYIKPAFEIELFEVETIMDGTPTPTPTVSSPLLNQQITIETAGTINFTDGNTLNSIDYSKFQ